MEFERLQRRLLTAIELLRVRDFYLIKNDLNERSLTHKLAEHLQYTVGNSLDVDCEYNRDIEASKKIYVLKSEIMGLEQFRDRHFGSIEILGEEYCEISIYPDIIVHKRGSNNRNLLAIEVKKSTSAASEEYDYLKLKHYTERSGANALSYEYGVFIKLNTGKNKYKVPEIKWFRDGCEYNHINSQVSG